MKADFNKMVAQKTKQIYNHLEFHKEMTRKNELFNNMLIHNQTLS
jgi:hypothetical protein